MEPAIPQHLAIIMDGNRRWARERGLPTFEGHRVGYDKVKDVGEWCLARGISTLSFFAFSTENWKRTEEEVGYLMDLLERALTREKSFFLERDVRVRVVGRRAGLRPSIVRAIEEIERETAHGSKMTLALCLNYGGRVEIVDAVRGLMQEGVPVESVDETTIRKHLSWPDMPDPDLIVRTSGEQRLSGFLLWQSAYSELLFVDKHWPAFEEADLDAALEEYQKRQRRYGA
jgi:undecaprenyl diphosphate synthase